MNDQYDCFKQSRLPVGLAILWFVGLWPFPGTDTVFLLEYLLCRLLGLRSQAVRVRQMARPQVRCRNVRAL